MKRVNKAILLDRLELRVEQHLNEAVTKLQNLDSATLLRPAANGGWSIAQCLQHLNTYGDYYLPLLREGLNKQRQSSVSFFKSSWLGDYFTRMMEPATGSKKMKAAKGHIPENITDAHAVVAKFIHQQEVLLKCIRDARNKDLNTVKIPVSIFRWLKLKCGDVLQFLIAHNERHLLQAARNLA